MQNMPYKTLSESFDKDPYPVEVDPKSNATKTIYYFSEGGHDFKFEFSKKSYFGKKVYRLTLGQKTSNINVFQKIITRFTDPFRVVATLISVLSTFLHDNSGRVEGIAFGFPEKAFGAYANLLKRVVAKKLTSSLIAFDEDIQPNDDEKLASLKYVYFGTKLAANKGFKGIFNGELTANAAPEVKEAPVVAPTAPVGYAAHRNAQPPAQNNSPTQTLPKQSIPSEAVPEYDLEAEGAANTGTLRTSFKTLVSDIKMRQYEGRDLPVFVTTGKKGDIWGMTPKLSDFSIDNSNNLVYTKTGPMKTTSLKDDKLGKLISKEEMLEIYYKLKKASDEKNKFKEEISVNSEMRDIAPFVSANRYMLRYYGGNSYPVIVMSEQGSTLTGYITGPQNFQLASFTGVEVKNKTLIQTVPLDRNKIGELYTITNNDVVKLKKLLQANTAANSKEHKAVFDEADENGANFFKGQQSLGTIHIRQSNGENFVFISGNPTSGIVKGYRFKDLFNGIKITTLPSPDKQVSLDVSEVGDIVDPKDAVAAL